MQERAVTLKIKGQELLSIHHHGGVENNIGVIIIVGGPQYRVGSHRQFVQLARYLAQNGITTMRFDYRGMGDSEGNKQDFDEIDDDIKVAIDSFMNENTHLEKVVLWGLCDAASASLIYSAKDERVCAQILLNPWLKSDQAKGKTMVKHYYLQRLMSKSFWRKLLTGKVNVSKSMSEAKGFVQDSIGEVESEQGSYQVRMLNGLNNYSGQISLLLSGNDLTAKEFEQQITDNEWQKFYADNCKIFRLPDADHTFSTIENKKEVERITLSLLKDML